MATILRGSVVGLIYQQSLSLDLTSPGVTPSAALTLVSTDTDTIVMAMYQFHEVWGAFLEIAVAIYLIWRQMGAACAMPIVCAIGKIRAI